MATLKRCSKCASSAGTCTCTGCRQLFCPLHFNDHRKHLSEQMEQVKGNSQQLATKTQETIQTQRTGSSIFSQIDEWQRVNIERITRAADTARQQAVELLRRKKIEIMKGIESVNVEIRTRQGTGDFIEDDIERLRKNLNRLQQDLDQFNRRPVELRTRKNDQIDWNNMIYIERQYGDNFNTTLETPRSSESMN